MGGLFGNGQAEEWARRLDARVAEIERTVGIRRAEPDAGLEAAVAEVERALGMAPPDDDHGVAAAVAALVGGPAPAEIPGGEEGRPRSEHGPTVAAAGADGGRDGAAPGTDSLDGAVA